MSHDTGICLETQHGHQVQAVHNLLRSDSQPLADATLQGIPLTVCMHINVCMYVCMYVWMYGWMDGWMDGCMDAWMDGCMDAWMHGCMDAWMDGWMDGWMNE